MKHLTRSLLGISLTLVAAQVHSQVIIDENFDSYADTAAMQATWGSAGLGVLVTTNGNGGNSAYHPGGTVNNITSISVAPSLTNGIRLTVDIYDDGTSANKRTTMGLRNGADPLFEMGMYNAPSHYAARILNFSGNENWVAFPTNAGFVNIPAVGWHRFTAEIFPNLTTVTLDLFADGSVDSSINSLGGPSANSFVDLRFGGPSNLSSAGGGVWFDNIRLELIAVPEPSTVALSVLGGLALAVGLIRRRRS